VRGRVMMGVWCVHGWVDGGGTLDRRARGSMRTCTASAAPLSAQTSPGALRTRFLAQCPLPSPLPQTPSSRRSTRVHALPPARPQPTISRSPILEPVSWLPSRPASGEVLGEKTMERVGGSMRPAWRRGEGKEEGWGA
jgi:hypothetical protein